MKYEVYEKGKQNMVYKTTKQVWNIKQIDTIDVLFLNVEI